MDEDDLPIPRRNLFDLGHGEAEGRRFDQHIFECKQRLSSLEQERDRFRPRDYEELLQTHTDELQTWQLLSCLYEVEAAGEQPRYKDPLDELFSHQAIFQRFQHSPQLQRYGAVLSWLEGTGRKDVARKDPSELTRTKRIIQREQSSQASHPNIVDKLDPDAVFRQHKLLDPEDEKDESLLMEYLWYQLRSGRFEEAVTSLLVKQPWRALSLSGFLPFHHHLPASNEQTEETISGNRNRFVWKAACRKIAQLGQNKWERAVYGCLGHDLGAALSVCFTWEDKCWLFFKTLYEQALDKLLLEELQREPPSVVSTPAAFLQPKFMAAQHFTNASSVFDELAKRTDTSSNISRCYEEFRLIQKNLILGDYRHIISDLANWIQSRPNTRSLEFYRFAVKMFLELRAIMESSDQKIEPTVVLEGNAIIGALVALLAQLQLLDEIPYYVSLLPEDVMIQMFTHFLLSVPDVHRRTELLEMSKDHIPEHCRATVARQTVAPVLDVVHAPLGSQESLHTPEELLFPLGHESKVVSEADLQKMSAVDMLLVDQQYQTALIHVNALFRYFIGRGKRNSATAFLQKLDELDIIRQFYVVYQQVQQYGSGEEVWVWQSHMEELRHWQSYLHLLTHLEAFLDKLQQSVPAYAVLNVSQQAAFKRQHEVQFEQVAEGLISVLTFTDANELANGFLNWPRLRDTTPHSTEHDWSIRQQQLDALRKQCIPQLSHLFIHLCKLAHRPDSALTLADALAESNFRLYEAFEKTTLSGIVHQMKNAFLDDLIESHYAD